MSQPIHKPGSDEPGRTHQQDLHPAPRASAFVRSALISGTWASLLSTGVIAWAGRRNAGTFSAGINATSHWLWGARARHRDAPSLRYTATGYAIHHAMSLLWAGAFETLATRTRQPAKIAAAASATAGMAYLVDYHVVTRRLNPGFESRLPPRAMFATYAAFAAGLGLAKWWQVRHRRTASVGRRPVPQQPGG